MRPILIEKSEGFVGLFHHPNNPIVHLGHEQEQFSVFLLKDSFEAIPPLIQKSTLLKKKDFLVKYQWKEILGDGRGLGMQSLLNLHQ